MSKDKDNDNDNNSVIGETEDQSVTVARMSNAIADRLVSARHHQIPVFSGAKNECPIKFIRTFERVAKALKWEDETKVDKFPNYLSGPGEEFYYINVDCVPETQQVVDWDDLKELFLNHFMRGDYKSHLTRELRAHKKSDSETMIVYITAIQTICYDLDKNMSEEQIINYCLDGMDPEIASQIQIFNPTTVKELINYSKKC